MRNEDETLYYAASEKRGPRPCFDAYTEFSETAQPSSPHLVWIGSIRRKRKSEAKKQPHHEPKHRTRSFGSSIFNSLYLHF